jgi:hypothetical protein
MWLIGTVRNNERKLNKKILGLIPTNVKPGWFPIASSKVTNGLSIVKRCFWIYIKCITEESKAIHT